MIAAVVALALGLLVALAVALPLWRRGTAADLGERQAGPSEVRGLLDRRDTLLAALRELETDRGLGNLSDEEYRGLREDYERKAAAVLKALDERSRDLAEEAEGLVQAERQRRAREVANVQPSATLARIGGSTGSPRTEGGLPRTE